MTGATQQKADEFFDVIVIGAGLSGIGSAYWLQKKCPGKKFAVLEARATLGGTWDLFRYPGIRSDSDMFTFGYRFKPWQNPQPISKGGEILKYLEETVRENQITDKIRFGHKVVRANWSDETSSWMLEVESPSGIKQIETAFLFMCSGYYSYEEAYRPKFEQEHLFKGQIVLPQFWPKDLNYSGKKVVVVGSGATAVTVVPSMAPSVDHVTMLQRSPTYVMTLPNENKVFKLLKKVLPGKFAFQITRVMNILLTIGMFSISRAFPNFFKGLVMKSAAKQLPQGFDVKKHFNPKYNPWDQRLCVVPDGDLFKAISTGKASVETDEITQFTENGIQLKSGKHLDADIIVLATGLKMKILGGIQITINRKPVVANQQMVYKGMMISDVPNLAIAFGYTNASWTLKSDLTAGYVCRLLNYMDSKNYRVVVPQRETDVEPEPFLNFNSGYVLRAGDLLPKQGSRKPWRVHQNYLKDMLTIRYGRINDGVLRFK
jgi:monooxygenase